MKKLINYKVAVILIAVWICLLISTVFTPEWIDNITKVLGGIIVLIAVIIIIKLIWNDISGLYGNIDTSGEDSITNIDDIVSAEVGYEVDHNGIRKDYSDKLKSLKCYDEYIVNLKDYCKLDNTKISESIKASNCKTFNSFVKSSFLFNNTKEGFTYWNEISNTK
jgi:hypothetical protein